MDMIPAFPLSIIAFPGETIKLHIFESRYRQMFGEIEERNTTFALIPYYENRKNTVGTEMKLIRIIEKYDDGKLDIEVEAIAPLEVHKLLSKYPNRLYPGAEVSRLPWNDEMDRLSNPDLILAIHKLYSIMNISNVNIKDSSAFRTHQLAHKVGFNLDQELEFVKISTEEDRQTYMLNHLMRLLPIAEEMKTLRKRAEMNGHIQNLKPPF
ncbi:MAG: LON peptidase substrate-binding domain-containing protein [Saprospiraceae bacterium]|jgi:hypothetical protein|nr:LON peptidase substrate-binding domain-containing protein [Saprospiraceae bacterium]